MPRRLLEELQDGRRCIRQGMCHLHRHCGFLVSWPPSHKRLTSPTSECHRQPTFLGGPRDEGPLPRPHGRDGPPPCRPRRFEDPDVMFVGFHRLRADHTWIRFHSPAPLPHGKPAIVLAPFGRWEPKAASIQAHPRPVRHRPLRTHARPGLRQSMPDRPSARTSVKRSWPRGIALCRVRGGQHSADGALPRREALGRVTHADTRTLADWIHCATRPASPRRTAQRGGGTGVQAPWCFKGRGSLERTRDGTLLMACAERMRADCEFDRGSASAASR